MLILGLVFIIAAAVLGAGVALDGSESASVEILGTRVDTSIAGVFFTGAGTMLLLILGVWMLMSATARARRKRAERKESRRRHKASVSALEEERTQLRAENERLQEQVGRDRATGTTAAGAATAASRDDRSATRSDVGADSDTGRTGFLGRGNHARTDADAGTATGQDRVDHTTDIGTATGTGDRNDVDVRQREPHRG